MKTKAFLSICLFLFSSFVYGQNNNPNRLQGSWLGKIVVPNGPEITSLMHFKLKAKTIVGSFDSPDQSMKGLSMDSVWIVKDSVFAEFSGQLGPGSRYKGAFLPGDSVIDGNWIQGGGSFALKLRPTTYEYIQKINSNPHFEGYKIIKLIATTPIKDQQNTGTCWSHATTSFIETEAMRLGKKPVVLSPMFFVTPTYLNKAERYIRVHGNQSFNEGDLTFSVLKAYIEFGAIPEEVYSGRTDSDAAHNHFGMDQEATKKVKQFVEAGFGKMSVEEYRKSIAEIVYKAMPKAPGSFNFEGKTYTTKSFAEEKIGINPDDYVEITSYTHQPFYKKCILEIPANWNNNAYLNVPLTDFVKIIDHALLNNYSVAWDGDIKEGYHDGFCKLEKEQIITQQIRQAAFDNYTTQDDHNMHIIGVAEGKDGKRFYIVKNSAVQNNNGGYVYMSKEYLQLKTISVMTHKAGIPKEILNKLMVKL
ncbi:MAG: Bleomycin hydrolase [Daejeonella sp.]|nr:Bleomycin hydrolase [Daejeonella sp.]